METIVKWLIEQIPVVVVMGICIVYLYKHLIRIAKQHREDLKQKDILLKQKDDAVYQITQQVLKVAALWDVKSDLNTKEHESILSQVDKLSKLATEISYVCRSSK